MNETQAAIQFVDPDYDPTKVKFEPKVEISEPPDKTFDGNWSDDDNDHFNQSIDDFEFEIPKPKQRSRSRKIDADNLESRINLGKHKLRSLVGKLACKYCDTLFSSRGEKDLHACKYLQCKNKNNFICRFCNKELSKQSFSNHVHEATECQYCGRKILNPRNMKLHIQKKHKNAKYIPPKERNVQEYIKEKVEEEKRILEIRGELSGSSVKKEKKRYECDLCGRYIASLFSLRFHMKLHLGIPHFVCPICGEKFFTPTGMKNHNCIRRQSRPKKDFRIADARYCKFCETSFATMDQNKKHICKNLDPDHATSFVCRYCGGSIKKSSFRRHMVIHKYKLDHNRSTFFYDTGYCRVCDTRFPSFEANKAHFCKYNNLEDPKMVICRCCGKSVGKNGFNRHMETHAGIDWVCELCDKKLKTERALNWHKKKKHAM
jgi:hypothetical protein